MCRGEWARKKIWHQMQIPIHTVHSCFFRQICPAAPFVCSDLAGSLYWEASAPSETSDVYVRSQCGQVWSVLSLDGKIWSTCVQTWLGGGNSGVAQVGFQVRCQHPPPPAPPAARDHPVALFAPCTKCLSSKVSHWQGVLSKQSCLIVSIFELDWPL